MVKKTQAKIRLDGYHFIRLRYGKREVHRLAKIISVKNPHRVTSTAKAIIDNRLIPVTRCYGRVWFATIETR